MNMSTDTARKPAPGLYVDREAPSHWIVRDRDGRFWIVPPGENAWTRRLPFHPDTQTHLEPIPRHYLHMLGLPI